MFSSDRALLSACQSLGMSAAEDELMFISYFRQQDLILSDVPAVEGSVKTSLKGAAGDQPLWGNGRGGPSPQEATRAHLCSGTGRPFGV